MVPGPFPTSPRQTYIVEIELRSALQHWEVFSLWAESDKKYGGLSLSYENVGQVLAVAGGSLLLYQIFIYPCINKVLDPVNACRIAASQDQRGAANGLAMTGMSFFKAAAPAGAGIV